MTSDDLRQQIELKIVELIKEKLSDGSMTEDRAQEISQMVLNSLKPGMSFEELYKVIPKLDDMYNELSPIVLPLVRDYENRIVKEAKKEVQSLIRQGQYDAAINLAQQAVKQDVKLEWIGSSHQKN